MLSWAATFSFSGWQIVLFPAPRSSHRLEALLTAKKLSLTSVHVRFQVMKASTLVMPHDFTTKPTLLSPSSNSHMDFQSDFPALGVCQGKRLKLNPFQSERKGTYNSNLL